MSCGPVLPVSANLISNSHRTAAFKSDFATTNVFGADRLRAMTLPIFPLTRWRLHFAAALAIAASTTCCLALADSAVWETIAAYQGSRSQLDRTSIRVSDNKIFVSIRFLWDEPLKLTIASIPITEQLSHYEIDCDARKVTLIDGRLLNGGEVTLNIGRQPSSDIRPATPVATVADQLCPE
jgi:hypothetical protein